MGWERYTMLNGLNIDFNPLGASAPADDQFERFASQSTQLFRR
jgi:hypothetical protein